MKKSNKKLRFGIPKGSLQDYTLRVFGEAGFNVEVPERSYIVKIDDPGLECFLLRPQEIPKYVERGMLDAGISGEDWILDSGAKVIEVCDLRYAKQEIRPVRWVLAVPKDSPIRRVQDLEGKIIASEAVNLVKDYLEKNKVQAMVEFSWGTTEVKPPLFADAIVDITETGASLRAHNLKILDTVLESSTKLIANTTAFKDKWQKEKIENLALLLQGAVRGEEVVNLMMHIPGAQLNEILQVLPKLKLPTVRKIAGENWYDVAISCEAKETRDLIPKLKRLGCGGIVQCPVIKLVP